MTAHEAIISSNIICVTRSWLGTPYIHQASLKGVGCDCLGLIRGVYSEITGKVLPEPPPYSADWAEASPTETLVEAARIWLNEIRPEQFEAGDVVLFRWRAGLPAKHCGIATSTTTMIHAHDGASVSEVAIGPWWRRHLSHAFRF
jgi:NlpC/P60 family putative phage cell wall peptidase